MNPKFNRPLLTRSFWLATLLLVLLLLFLIGLSAGVRGGLTWLFVISGLSGAMAAYAISFTRLRNWQAGVLLVISGFLGMVIYIARLGELLPPFINSLIILRTQLIFWTINRTPLPDFLPLGLILTDLFERFIALFTRVWIWFSGIRMGAVMNDPVARAFTSGLAVFLLAAWTRWMMGRYRNPLAAFAPLIVVLAIVADYTGEGFTPLWLLLTGVLITHGLYPI